MLLESWTRMSLRRNRELIAFLVTYDFLGALDSSGLGKEKGGQI